jgi:hypothetical protein
MGILIARVLAHRNRRAATAIVAAAALGLIADGWARIPVASVPRLPLRPELLAGKIVLELPLGTPLPDIAATFRAVTGGWRTINGFSGYEPAGYAALRAASAQDSDAILDHLRDLPEMHLLIAADFAGLSAIERHPDCQVPARPQRDGDVPTAPPLHLRLKSLAPRDAADGTWEPCR